MLARWTEILPLFVIRWLALQGCERVFINREEHERLAAMARPDVLIVIKEGAAK